MTTLFSGGDPPDLSPPLNPYGFQINWDGTPEWAFKTLANPPLVPAYFAAWHCLFPWNEISFHVAVLPFSLIALYAFGLIATHFNVDSTTAQVLLCCSPAFFLGSQVLMQDVPMLSLFLLAVGCAIRYDTQEALLPFSFPFLRRSAVRWAKYNGLVLVPVLLVLVLAGNRKRGLVSLVCAPLFSLALWCCFTWFKYEQNHFLAMAAFEKNPGIRTPLWQLIVGTLGATGLGVLPATLLDFMARIPKWRKALWTSAALIVTPICAYGTWVGYGKLSSFLLAISAWLALQLVGLAFFADGSSIGRNIFPGLVLVAWILCGLAFQSALLFSSVRYVLFLAPSYSPRVGTVLTVSAEADLDALDWCEPHSGRDPRYRRLPAC